MDPWSGEHGLEGWPAVIVGRITGWLKARPARAKCDFRMRQQLPRIRPFLRPIWRRNLGSLALPVRRALVEEGVHALAEILAHIGTQDQILALVTRQRAADAAHRLLGDGQRDRGVRGYKLRGLVGAALQG